MPPHKALPQELIDQVIDELGDAYRDPNHEKRSDHRTSAHEALHACALISKNWKDRSRTHLFEQVKIKGDEDDFFTIPPQPLMPYVKKLKIQLQSQHYRLFPTPHLFTPFYTAPVVHLGITAGVLAADARGCLVECIAALSATLQTVIFKSCSLSLHLIHDIASIRPNLKLFHLLDCNFEPAKSENSVIPHPGTRPGALTDLELGVLSRSVLEGHDPTVAAVSQLPNKFCRLDLDHVRGLYATRATNALIQANAESLSSLKVHIVSPEFRRSENQPPFSLDGCFNLSELTLDMDRTDLCIVTTSVDILSTLDSMRRNNLECIRLTTSCVYRWLREESRTELTHAWGNLDVVLSELTKAAIGVRGKRLTFVLVSTGGHKEGCLSFGRKWLSKMLPRFHELGSLELNVDHRRSRLRLTPNDAFSRFHGPDCMREDL